MSSGEYCHFRFLPDMKDWHINALELVTVVIACKIWGHLWTGLKIQILCDNEATVSVINSGRTKDPIMQRCLRELSYVTAVNQFQVRSYHVSGVSNRLADCLSRWDTDIKYKKQFLELTKYDNLKEVYVKNEMMVLNENW